MFNKRGWGKSLTNESTIREEVRIWKDIKEKEIEEAKALLAKVKKREGKKGKKVIGDKVKFLCILFHLWYNLKL
jgi:hypothetical protein